MIQKAWRGAQSFQRPHPGAERGAAQAKARQALQGKEARGRAGPEPAVVQAQEAALAAVLVQAVRAAQEAALAAVPEQAVRAAGAAVQAANKRM